VLRDDLGAWVSLTRCDVALDSAGLSCIDGEGVSSLIARARPTRATGGCVRTCSSQNSVEWRAELFQPVLPALGASLFIRGAMAYDPGGLDPPAGPPGSCTVDMPDDGVGG
jgi:hypothetical protein